MTAITADNVNFFNTKALYPDGMYVDVGVAASTTIYRHSFVGLDVSGYLTSFVPWGQAATATGTPLVGIAVEGVDNSSGSNGDKKCRVFVEGYFEYALSAAAQLDMGKQVYAADNATLGISGTNTEPVGRIVGIASAGNVVVNMASPTVRSGWIGNSKTVVREIDFGGTVADELTLLHETENHNGIVLYSCNAYTTEQHECTDAAGVVTIVHTRGTDTTMGMTLTAVDGQEIGDLTIGAGGEVIGGVATATGDALVKAPADKAVIAKLTTASDDASLAGKGALMATFIAL